MNYMWLNKSELETIYTPEEIAERLKLSVATIYKLISEDVFPYFRVGKSYRIPAGAMTSYMMREGNLARFAALKPVIPRSALKFVHLIENLEEARKNVVAVIMFGSFARGTQQKESDIDLLVILKKNSISVQSKISELSSEAMEGCDFDEFLSPVKMSIEHWKKLKDNSSPLYEEIQREGVILWPKGSTSLKVIESGRGKS